MTDPSPGGGAPGSPEPAADWVGVVATARGRARDMIDEMLTRISGSAAASRRVDTTDPTRLHEALVTAVMRVAVRRAAEARGLVATGGRLFSASACPLLEEPALRAAIAPTVSAAGEALALLGVGTASPLPVEVVGSIYEGLIGTEPVRDATGGWTAARTAGRKRSGSYYTPPQITREVVRRALAPALARAAAGPSARRTEALLSLRVCDPALGAGAFLLEAARQLTDALLPSGEWSRELDVRREVVTRCLFGCDTSHLAVAMAEVSLWMLVGDPDLPVAAVGAGLRVGDALVGLSNDEIEPLRRAVPDGPDAGARLRAAADHVLGGSLVPTALREARRRVGEVTLETSAILHGGEVDVQPRRRACERGAFHWPLELAPAATERGFDVVLGNPPWVAFAGRAAQPLDPALRSHFARSYEAWRGYPTLHGLFVERAAQLAPQGVVALVVPSPLADLAGYRGVRRALSRRHVVREPLLEFGQDAFDEVVQPCIALVADPTDAPQPGEREWRLEERQRAAGAAASVDPPAILERLTSVPVFPPEVFRELGFQTTSTVTKTMLRRADEPDATHTVPLLEGRNVSEFFVGEPRLFLAADAERLRAAGARLRSVAQYANVDFVVRQTAAVPIAARHTGLPFRNSLLAGFAPPGMSCELVVGLLNSALYRALHLARRRDARQAAFPQVKIAHLRQLPAPLPGAEPRARIEQVATELGAAAQRTIDLQQRSRLDEAVFDLFDVSVDERGQVLRFLVDRNARLGYSA